MAIAFFDLDRTVIAANSASLWIARELRDGHVSRLEALRGAFWLALYATGFVEVERAISDAAATLRGKPERDIEGRSRAFFEEEVRRLVRPGARQAIAAHRDRGDRVYLLTTSSAYLSQPISSELGLDGFLCNRLEVEDGIFTGRMAGALCYGAGKVAHAEELAATLGVSLADCTFYSDSYSDVPMLEAVGDPVAVNPDARLRRLANRRGWPIRDWGGAGESAAMAIPKRLWRAR